MFNSTAMKIEVPIGPYPKCDCGGTLLPVVIPSEYYLRGLQCELVHRVDTKHPQMRWKCQHCGKQV